MWCELENFTARYANGIQQEVAALMIIMQLTAELEAHAFDYREVETKNAVTKNHPLVLE